MNTRYIQAIKFQKQQINMANNYTETKSPIKVYILK